MVLIQTKEYDEILRDMLSRFENKYDIRQGSVLYNIFSAAAQEIAQEYMYLEEYTNLMFLDTSYGEALTRLASQHGTDRKPATSAVREVFFIENVMIGTRFSVIDSDMNFYVSDDLGGGMYYLTAEEPGARGNTIQGELLNIDYMDAFSGATLGRVVFAGEDEESDEDLRARTASEVRAPSLNGSVAQYESWVSEIEGVGSVKVEPIWNGPNTVKVSITDATGSEASSELVNRVQDYLDPEPHGHGLGVAPIGAMVTVESITAIAVTITADIKLVLDFDLETVREQVAVELQSYFNAEAFQDEEIKTYKVLTVIDRTLGIQSVENVKINGANSNLAITNGVPPILNEVILNVI